MNHPSRLETNFRRLLSQCNRLVAEGKFQEWRLETYVSSLENMLLDLKQNPSCPDKEVMADYGRQVEFLKGVIRADKLPTPSEKAMAHQLIPRGFTVSNEKITKEIHLKTTEKYTDEMRKELLGSDGVRHRTISDSPDEDYDTMLKYHQTMQEKVAEEMVLFARNLKENSLLAGAIVRKDTEKTPGQMLDSIRHVFSRPSSLNSARILREDLYNELPQAVGRWMEIDRLTVVNGGGFSRAANVVPAFSEKNPISDMMHSSSFLWTANGTKQTRWRLFRRPPSLLLVIAFGGGMGEMVCFRARRLH